MNLFQIDQLTFIQTHVCLRDQNAANTIVNALLGEPSPFFTAADYRIDGGVRVGWHKKNVSARFQRLERKLPRSKTPSQSRPFRDASVTINPLKAEFVAQ